MKNSQRGFVNIILIALVVILAGVLGYVTLIKKSEQTEQQQPGETTQPSKPKSAVNIIPANIPPAQPVAAVMPSLPTTCVDKSEGVPVITSISPSSGPIGTKVEIRGCNFLGFEGDRDAVFVGNDNAEILLYGGSLNPSSNEEELKGKLFKVTVQSYCASGSETGRYSGITSSCKTIEAIPGNYKVYVTAWGKKSNEAAFTIK